MIVTAWNNGNHHKTGAGYGFKLSIADRDTYIKRDWSEIRVTLPGNVEVIANVNKASFWSDSCREIINREFGSWLISNGYAPWEKGCPPKFDLVHKGKDRFVLRKLGA